MQEGMGESYMRQEGQQSGGLVQEDAKGDGGWQGRGWGGGGGDVAYVKCEVSSEYVELPAVGGGGAEHVEQ